MKNKFIKLLNGLHVANLVLFAMAFVLILAKEYFYGLLTLAWAIGGVRISAGKEGHLKDLTKNSWFKNQS